MSAPAPVAILAGAGTLPLLLAATLESRGHAVRILAFRGFAERPLRARADAILGLLDLRGIEATLASWAPSCVTLAGGLRRPDPSALLDAFSLFRDRAEVADVLARGDDNLLRGAVSLLEERGFPVRGIRDLAPDLLAPVGAYGRHQPSPDAAREIAFGLDVIRSLSPYDIGQAVILRGRHVLAIEGPEGTDAALRRSRAFRVGPVFRRRQPRGTLVKAPKEGQDLRVDLPAIGPRTVVQAARAGLAGIAVASGVTLVLDQAATVATADRLGLFVTGVEAAGQAR